MATFQLVVADPDSGTTYQREVDGQDANRFLGRELGDEVEFEGLTLELTGGSDETGRPMRADAAGTALKELLLEGGVGFDPSREGERRRVTVRGREVAEDVAQLNAAVVEGDAAVAFGDAEPEESGGADEAADGEDDTEDAEDADADADDEPDESDADAGDAESDDESDDEDEETEE